MTKEAINFENKAEHQDMGLDRLKDYLKLEAEEMRKNGVPVGLNGRIDPNAYINFYSERVINEDRQAVSDLKLILEGEENNLSNKREQRIGEQLELLATAVLSLYLKDRYYVMRSSEYDDLKHKVDTILFDKRTGQVVCAFDEVGDTSSERFKKKKEEILAIDRERNGTHLKYGLELDPKTLKVKPGRNYNIPIFYICVAPDIVKKCVEEFTPDKNQKNNKNLFEYFLYLLSFQTKEMVLKSGHLKPEMIKKISSFEKSLKDYFLIKTNI